MFEKYDHIYADEYILVCDDCLKEIVDKNMAELSHFHTKIWVTKESYDHAKLFVYGRDNVKPEKLFFEDIENLHGEKIFEIRDEYNPPYSLEALLYYRSRNEKQLVLTVNGLKVEEYYSLGKEIHIAEARAFGNLELIDDSSKVIHHSYFGSDEKNPYSGMDLDELLKNMPKPDDFEVAANGFDKRIEAMEDSINQLTTTVIENNKKVTGMYVTLVEMIKKFLNSPGGDIITSVVLIGAITVFLGILVYPLI